MRCEWVNNGYEIRIWFDFDQDFIDEMKDTLPRFARRWFPAEKCWLIHPDYWPDLLEILDRYDYEVEERETGKKREEEAASSPLDSLWLKLDPLPPRSLVDVSYRTLAQMYHPDHGGSNEAMKKINLAYERLRKITR